MMKLAFLIPALLLCTASVTKARTYWQQRVDTRLEVLLDDKNHILHGHEEISYTNNSPDTLRYIYVHLWANAYQHDHTQFAEQQYRNGHTEFYYAKPSERGYIDSLQFSIDGNDVDYFYGESTPDIARIDLPRPLAPGQQMKIRTPFRVKLPVVFSRLGHTDQAYFVSQWFPKPAVYDHKGWHPIPYLDLGEFYSEIGSYDVRITLPRNYVVMATGNLQTEREQKWLDSLSTLPVKKDSLRKIVTTTTVNGQKKRIIVTTDFPESAAEMKTLHYTEDNVHDFAWFADKRWVVRKDTVMSPGSNMPVTTWSAYLPGYDKTWSKANEHLKNAIRYYGKWVGPYPYQTIKAVQGDMKAGGGMEYPTVTIIDKNAGDQTVIIHEAGHNWFYGILATNERDHAWLDEGLNSFYELKTTKTLARARLDTARVKRTRKGTVNVDLGMNAILHQLAASGEDQAIAQTSNNMKEINYGMGVYYKTAALLDWLEAYMGKDSFEAGMHDYYDTWKYKHPYPEDFKEAMQRHTDKSIDWFFEQALQEDRRIDFSVKADHGKTEDLIVVKNRSDKSYPVLVDVYDGDSVVSSVWSVTEAKATTSTPVPVKNWTKLRINPAVFDGRPENNVYHNGGLFHRSGLSIKFLSDANLSPKRKLFVLPAIGYNMYDGFEGGLLFHNLRWPETRFKYALAPMYGFKSKEFIGAGSISYTARPKNTFREITFQIDAKTFNYQDFGAGYNSDSSVYADKQLFARYYKIAPSLTFVFKNPAFISPVTRSLMIKGYAIGEDNFNFQQDVTDSLIKPSVQQQQKYYGLLRYTHRNDRTFNPFNYSIEGQAGEDFIKLAGEANLKINYHSKGKSLHVRAFAGKYFSLNDNSGASRYYLNSTFTGVNDYLYDDTYIGRTEREGFGIRQVSIREGGLKIPTPLYASPLGRSDNWLAALNLKTDLPLKKLPVRLFADIATFADAGKLNPSGDKVLFDAGVEIYILDIINIYIPVVMSKDFNDYRKSITGKTGLLDAVTFSINLQRINWLKAPSEVFKLAGY